MKRPYFWFVAGEESGDARAVEVMNAMRNLRPDIRFGGAGGERMAALSDPEFDNWVHRAAVVGIWDVLRHYGYFRQKFHTMLGAIRRENPDAVVLVTTQDLISASRKRSAPKVTPAASCITSARKSGHGIKAAFLRWPAGWIS